MTVKREEKETRRGSQTVPPAGEPVTVTTPSEQRRQEELRRDEKRSPEDLQIPVPIHPTER